MQAGIPALLTSKSRLPGPTALAATANGELVSVPSFTGAPEQLWRLDQLTDGSWRVMPKSAGDAKEPLALSAIGARSVTLSKFDPASQAPLEFQSPLSERTENAIEIHNNLLNQIL